MSAAIVEEEAAGAVIVEEEAAGAVIVGAAIVSGAPGPVDDR